MIESSTLSGCDVDELRVFCVSDVDDGSDSAPHGTGGIVSGSSLKRTFLIDLAI